MAIANFSPVVGKDFANGLDDVCAVMESMDTDETPTPSNEQEQEKVNARLLCALREMMKYAQISSVGQRCAFEKATRILNELGLSG